MKTIIVGDTHGRVELVETILGMEENIVFIGDYVDSYDRTVGEQLRVLDLVLNAITTSEGKVRGLLGNHEMSYTDTQRMRCSGFNHATYLGMRERDLSPLLTHIWLDSTVLLSHAGVSQTLLDARQEGLMSYLGGADFSQIGRARGGSDTCGGLFWCDWWNEFQPVDGISQIVGHSNYRPEGCSKGIIKRNGDFNIDCLDRVPEVLLYDDEHETYTIKGVPT